MRTNIKKTAILFLVLALLLGFAGNTFAAGSSLGTMYVVNCYDWVSLRSTPSTSGERLAKVPYATQLKNCQSYNSEFAYCCYEGQWGYIQLKYLSSTPEAGNAREQRASGNPNDPGAAEQSCLSSNFWSMYSGYSTFYGQTLSNASYRSGLSMGDCLFSLDNLYQTVVNCKSFVSLRKEANAYATCLVQIPLGSLVETNGECGSWTLCRYAGRYGWVKSEYLEIDYDYYDYANSEYEDDDDDTEHYCNDYDYDNDSGYDYDYDSERALTSAEVTAFASSELTDQYGTYPAENACDGKTTTTWSEGAGGYGNGETLTFSFDCSKYITSFEIWSGYQKDTRRFYKNNRPSQITVYAGGEYQGTIELEDTTGMQGFGFYEPVYTDYIELRIDSVYYGNECNDTCISEVVFYAAE